MSREDVFRAPRSVPPAPVTKFYVEIDGRRFPPTQLVRVAAGTRAFVLGEFAEHRDPPRLHSEVASMTVAGSPRLERRPPGGLAVIGSGTIAP